jgi:S-adenosylmethionine decarboxylase
MDWVVPSMEPMARTPFWGKHSFFDCAGCSILRLKDPDNITEFLSELVDRIDMKAYGDPILAHFATHDPTKGGYTFAQMIETSLIDGHLVEETREAYISVHSCKDFDSSEVVKCIEKYFLPNHITVQDHYRQA